MNESQNPIESENAQEEIALLRHQLNSTLMLVLGVAIIATWFFAYQFYYGLKDSRRVAAAAKETQARLEQFNANEPAFQDFIRKLQDYSKTHPDVVPILQKYGALPVAKPAATAPKK